MKLLELVNLVTFCPSIKPCRSAEGVDFLGEIPCGTFGAR